MKRHVHRIGLPILLVLILCISLFAVPAFADGDGTLTAAIPIKVTVQGEEGTREIDIPTETYTFKIEALNDGPMPESDTLTITGAGSASFSMVFDTVGIYQYKVSQDASGISGENSTCNNRGKYDDVVYYITVTMINIETGDYGVVVAAHEGSFGGEKISELAFVNKYDPVPYETLTVKKIWTDNGQTRPTSIQVQLMDGETLVETVELTQDNWSYTWTDLDPDIAHDLDVREVAVDGYTAEYTKAEDGTIIIHNVGNSTNRPNTPQTGDSMNTTLWMGLLLISGLGLIAAFLLMRRSREEE